MTVITRFKVYQYYKPGRPNVFGFWYLRGGPRLGPARSIWTAINIPHGAIREGAYNPLRRFRLRICGGRSLLPPHFRWGVTFIFLFVVIVSGRTGSIVFGHHVQSAFSARTLPVPFGCFLGRLLRHVIRRQKQHLRQKWEFFLLWKRSRKVNLLRHLDPGLVKQVEELSIHPQNMLVKGIPRKH